MPEKVLVVADPVEKWDRIGETTFCLIAEASRRGMLIHLCTPEDLRFDRGKFLALTRKMGAEPKTDLDSPFQYAVSMTAEEVDLTEMDAVLLRKDPPIDLAYIHHLQLLLPLEDKIVFCNRPSVLLKWNEKLSTLAFPKLIAPTLVHVPRRSGMALDANPSVRKNLVDSQARGVRKLTREEMAESSEGADWFLDQPFNPKVSAGDKRILLFNGKFIGGYNKVPKAGDWRSNARYGSKLMPLRLSAQEKELIRRVGSWARKEKIFLVGIDMLDGKLSEINLTSVRGVLELRRTGGPDLAPLFWKRLLR